jgi:large subunit ribosomal protein L21
MKLKIEKLEQAVGEKVKFLTLLVSDEAGEKVQIGQPELGEVVEAEVKEHGKSDKVSVVKFKSKVRYRRNVGHRQMFTKVEIKKIA